MFGTLVESNPRPTRRRGMVVVSAAVHAAVILFAVRATAGGAEGPPPVAVIADTLGPYVHPAIPQSSTPPAGDPSRGGTSSASVPMPDASSLPTVGLDISPELPPVDVTLGNPFRSRMAEPVGVRAGDRGGRGSAVGVLDGRLADKPALPLEGNVLPDYPDRLRAAGIEGLVELEFVIEASGRIRDGSIIVIRSDHPHFLQAVRAALPRYRFLPAEFGGRPVDVRVRQKFDFRLAGGR